uniref:Uncharacterized protein n=1 Tax=Chrysemys picta bellii TaxID=8478 RepID=A0A8C3H7H8_CHRPI
LLAILNQTALLRFTPFFQDYPSREPAQISTAVLTIINTSRIIQQYVQYLQNRSKKRQQSVDPCEVWCSKPVHVLKDYCDVIKIYIVWPFLFKLENKTDFSNSYFCELSLKRLGDIEVLEHVVDLAKKVVVSGRVFDIGAALAWVKCTGEFSVLQKLEELGDYCWPPLEAFFAKYKHYITKVALEDCNLVEEFEAQSCENCIKKSEFMKKRGNCEFSKENLDFAIKLSQLTGSSLFMLHFYLFPTCLGLLTTHLKIR